MSRAPQFLIWFIGIFFFFWALVDPRFRSPEGFLEGKFCLPFSVGIAFVLLGCGVTGRFRKFLFWFTLALVGQAVALQMIDAGPYVRYQHYKSLYRLLIGTHPFLLIYLAAQTVFVFIGFRTRWTTIRDWLRHNFKSWQILCIGVVFFISSATVSKDISRYLVELFFSTFVQAVNLGNIILMVWAVPEDTLVRLSQRFEKLFGKHKKEDSTKPIVIDRFVVLAAIWVMVAASLLNYFVYERHPHIPDEITDFQHAKYLANGVLTSPAPTVPDAFEIYLMQVDGEKMYPVAPIGWPAVLSLGVLLRVPWLVNPVLAGLNMILIYLLIQVIFSRYIARMSILLLCVSPWYVFMGMSFMTHMSTLTFALCATLAVEKARKSGKAIWGWLGGGAVGMMSLIRPLEGLIVACLLGLWSIGLGAKRLKTSAITGLVMGSIMIGSVVLFYNRYLTGNPTVFPINAYLDQKFGPKSNALGFGPERGMGWEIDPFPGHGPIDGLVNANLNIFSINIELYGWSIGSLILIALLIFSGRLKREDYIMISVIAAVFIPHFFYYFSGGPDFGARYWFLMLIPLIALTVRGIDIMETKLGKGVYNTSFTVTRVKFGVLSLCFFTLVNYFPWRAADKYHHYRGMRPDIRKLAEENDFGKSLVLIRGDYTDYPSAWFYNPIDLREDAPVYAWDRNLDIRNQLLKEYISRPVWIINGPSITNKGYRVIEGPVSSQELLLKNQKINHLSFSTYFGGSAWEMTRDIFVDQNGDIYITGGTKSTDYPITSGVCDSVNEMNGPDTGSDGSIDVFISKFDSTGQQLIWSTFLGGPNYDRAYAIEVDAQGYVYVAGRAGPDFPTTTGAFQPTFQGSNQGRYGDQNAFVAKLTPDASDVVWASYIGTGWMTRDLAIDDTGNVYVFVEYYPDRHIAPPPSSWFTNSYQPDLMGDHDVGVAKIKHDGSAVEWATWLSGSGRESAHGSIRVDTQGYVYVAFHTTSTDMPTTSGVFDTTHNGANDLYVAKLSPDGSQLIFGTYVGDAGENWYSTHNMNIDNQGNTYVAFWGSSSFIPITDGPFHTGGGGGGSEAVVVKLSPTGSLLKSTWIGGGQNENPDGIYVDNTGNVFISGETHSIDMPVTTSTAYQSVFGGGKADAFCLLLSADFTELLYSTYMGGGAYDNGRSGFMDAEGKSFYITGSTDGTGWPTKNAYDSTFNGGGYEFGAGDCILAKFNI